jgi:hypothetical protein
MPGLKEYSSKGKFVLIAVSSSSIVFHCPSIYATTFFHNCPN